MSASRTGIDTFGPNAFSLWAGPSPYHHNLLATEDAYYGKDQTTQRGTFITLRLNPEDGNRYRWTDLFAGW